jgi:hypothetical protein
MTWRLTFLLCVALPLAARADLFREKVGPLLSERCVVCHGEKKRGGLDLSSRAGLRAGSENGPVVVAGSPEKSKLILMVSGPTPRMPRLGAKLTAAEVKLLRDWVADGAKWPDGVTLKERRVEKETWWSLRPIKRPVLPAVKNAAWVRNPIDRFILARLEKEGLKPSPPAEKLALLRRVTFDLTGLPPTPQEQDAFLADTRPDAYERVVNRLLASP